MNAMGQRMKCNEAQERPLSWKELWVNWPRNVELSPMFCDLLLFLGSGAEILQVMWTRLGSEILTSSKIKYESI